MMENKNELDNDLIKEYFSEYAKEMMELAASNMARMANDVCALQEKYGITTSRDAQARGATSKLLH